MQSQITQFFNQYLPEILLRSGEHLVLVAIAMTIAISIGIPLGILITRQPQLSQPILNIANAIQTIPSLAIFGFLISVPFIGGIGPNSCDCRLDSLRFASSDSQYLYWYYQR